MAVQLQYTKNEIMSAVKRRHETRPSGPFDQPKNLDRLKAWKAFAMREWMEIGERIFKTPEIQKPSYKPRHALD